MQWNSQLTKRHWLVCEPRIVPQFNRFRFKNLPSGPNFNGSFEKRAARAGVILSFQNVVRQHMWPPPPGNKSTVSSCLQECFAGKPAKNSQMKTTVLHFMFGTQRLCTIFCLCLQILPEWIDEVSRDWPLIYWGGREGGKRESKPPPSVPKIPASPDFLGFPPWVSI